jgi:predicted ATPase/class 3 adenylate cyclase
MGMELADVLSIPVALSRFCGRAGELNHIRDLLETDRLVTITGTGGIGKTRLALQVARSAGERYPGGVWLVELARVENPDQVAQAIAESVRAAPAQTGGPLERAIRRLAVGRHLLVLDNCEHVVQMAATETDQLLHHCQGLTVLATSREPLGVEGERAFPLHTLSVPEAGVSNVAGIAQTEAVQLFCDRAQLATSDTQLSAHDAADVATICRRLDGLPLALELAAAWVPVLSLKQVVTQLDDGLALLRRDEGGHVARHRTMRGALEWSYQLLSSPQQLAFARLSVFVGGFTLESAEAVLRNLSTEDASTLLQIAALVRRSLVVADTSKDEARYRLLEPLRQYAGEQLHAEIAEETKARGRHLAYFAQLAESAEEPILGGPDQPWLRRLDAELGNIRAALSWGFDNDPETAARLTTALIWFCGFRSSLFEAGRAWALQATSASGRLLARAYHMAGWLSVRMGDLDTAFPDLEQAHRLTAEGRWLPDLATVLFSEAMASYACGDFDAMRARGEDAPATARRLGDEARIMVALQIPALVASNDRDNKRALELWRELLAIAQKRGSQMHTTMFLTNILETALELNDLATAEDALRNGFESWTIANVADDGIAAYLLEGAGILAIQRDETATGLRLMSAADVTRTRTGWPSTPDDTARRRPWIETARGRLGDAVADAAWKRGVVMTLKEALEEAMSLVAGSPPPRETGKWTFMFTDIVRSTELVGVIGDDAWSNLIDWHNRTLREAFVTHGGEEVDSAGDGFFAAFADARSAIDCAVDIQRALDKHRRSHGFAPRVRIGLHAAIATRTSDGYRGKGVHVAARVAAHADGDEILVSHDTVAPLGDQYELSAPRRIALKGVSGEASVVSLRWQ